MAVTAMQAHEPSTPSVTFTPEPVLNVAAMFEGLASNPNVDVAKLEKLIKMQERLLRHHAKSAFDAAFSEMQGEIPIITERGEIKVNGVLRSKYARNEDIQVVVKPILQKHGFSLRFRNEFTDGKLKIIGILSHRSGHSEHDEFVTAADASGSKNDIQALGSARSYGQRYTTVSLLNIATTGEDDDAHRAGAKTPAPTGYDQWLHDMQAVSESDGLSALQDAWTKSKKEFQAFLTKTTPHIWSEMKAKAAKS